MSDEALIAEAVRRGLIKPDQLQQPATSAPLRPGYHAPRTAQAGNLDWIDRNIGVPLGIVGVDPVTGQPQRARSPLAPISEPLAQGATLGLYDEAEGLGGATARFLKQKMTGPTVSDVIKGGQPSFSDLYNQEVDKVRSEYEKQRTPYLTSGLELLGGLTAGGPAAVGQKALIAAPAAPRTIAQAMKVGGAYGGAYGAASGLGNSEGGLGNRLAGAATGGVIGGGTGAALPVGLKIGSLVTHGLKTMFGFGDASTAAKNLVLRAMERDGTTPEAALAKYNKWQAGGAKPELLADLGGENVKRLARDAISVPGQTADKASTMLYERNQGAGDRVVMDLTRSGMPNEGYYNSLDDLMKTRAENAGPIYDEAYRAAGEVWSPELARLQKRPSMRGAWARAKQLAAEQGRVLPDVFQENAMQGLDNVPDKMPTLEAWDYMKQGLDDMIEKYRDPTTGVLHLDKLGRAVNETRKQLLTALDDVVDKKVGAPIYQTARNQWAGPSQAMDALQAGRNVFGSDMEPTSKMIGKMTDAEKQFYRIGVVRALKDRIDRTKDGGSVLKQFWNSPGWRDKLQATFPDAQSFAQFKDLMDRETNLNRTYSVGTQGSRTASVEAGQKELGNLSFLGDLFTGNLKGAAGKAMRAGQGINSAVSDELGKILFGPTQQSVQSLAVRRAIFLQQQMRRASMAQRGLALPGTAAGMLGGAMNSNQEQ